MNYIYDVGESILIVVEIKNITTGLRYEDLSNVRIKVLGPSENTIVSSDLMTQMSVKGLYKYTLSSSSVTTSGLHLFEITPNAPDTNADNIAGSFLVQPKWITSINKVLGLTHSNILEDNIAYDTNNPTRKISSRIRTYKDSSSVGTSSNVLQEYSLIITYAENGTLKTLTMKEA